MSSEKHPNLQLHKWAPTDYVKREEWNENFGIIDDKIGILSQTTIRVIPTVTDLKTDTKLKEGYIVETLGYYAVNDGGAAKYKIEVADSKVDDGGSVIKLQNNLQAILIDNGYVNYKQFGAKGDGINDDGVQIKKTHEYANNKKIPVINLNGEYYIKATRGIPIKTNTDLGLTKIHIDESYNSTTPPFLVQSEYDPETFNTTQMSQLQPELKKGATQIPSLSSYSDYLFIVEDANTIAARRSGFSSVWTLSDFFVIQEHGRVVGEIVNTFNALTSVTAYKLDKNYLTIEGGIFLLNGRNTLANTDTYTNSGFKITRSRTRIKNQVIMLEDGVDDTSLNPSNGFYDFSRVFDVKLEDIRLIPRTQVNYGTYGIGGQYVLFSEFKNVVAEGDNLHWGVFGTNLFKNFNVINSKLNRVDVHYFCWNLYIKDCDIGYNGLTVSGGGDLIVENTRIYRDKFIEFRSDYGARWDGDIYIRNCRLVVNTTDSETYILTFFPSDFDYGYDTVLGRSIVVNNFVFDYNNPNIQNNKTAWCIGTPSFARFSSGSRVIFPTSMEFKNIRVNGRDKGVIIGRVSKPYQAKTFRQGLYDSTNNVLYTNCTWVFENIELAELKAVKNQPSYSEYEQYHLFFDSLATDNYIDNFCPMPKVVIRNCRGVTVHPKGSIASLFIENCSVNCMDFVEGGQGRGDVTFLNCSMKPDLISVGLAYSLDTTLGATFINCTFYPPIVNGVKDVTQWQSIYGTLIDPQNRYMFGTHVSSKLSKEAYNYFNTYIDASFTRAMMSRAKEEGGIYYVPRTYGTTAQRPSSSIIYNGFQYFDTTLGKPIWWNGSAWKDATGTTV